MDWEGSWGMWLKSSIVVGLGERIDKEGVELDEVLQGALWSTTKSGSQILQ